MMNLFYNCIQLYRTPRIPRCANWKFRMTFKTKFGFAASVVAVLCFQGALAQPTVAQAPAEKEAENRVAAMALPGGSGASQAASGGLSVQAIAIAAVAVAVVAAAASSSSNSSSGTTAPTGTTGTR
jgi:hypothetical protein